MDDDIVIKALEYYRETFLLRQIYEFKRYNLHPLLVRVDAILNANEPEGKPMTITITKEQIEFLNELRESGVTNMFGAGRYLIDEFDLNRSDAKAVLMQWIGMQS